MVIKGAFGTAPAVWFAHGFENASVGPSKIARKSSCAHNVNLARIVVPFSLIMTNSSQQKGCFWGDQCKGRKAKEKSTISLRMKPSFFVCAPASSRRILQKLSLVMTPRNQRNQRNTHKHREVISHGSIYCILPFPRL